MLLNAPHLLPTLHSASPLLPALSAQRTGAALADTAAALLIADADGKWLNASFDAAAALAIPALLAVLLFVFYRLLKLFASAF